MYKATRQLIAARTKHAYFDVEPVRVQNIGGGRVNDCFNNAIDVLEADWGVKVVSGWLVGPYCKATNSTEIISHFWNGQDNYDSLENLVCSSLLLSEGKFQLVSNGVFGAELIGNAAELDCKTLYAEHVIEKLAA